MTERQLRTITASLDDLGATLSTKAAKERTAVHRLAARVATLDLRNGVAAAAVTALEADRDPLDDPAVQREAARAALSESALKAQLDHRAGAFLTVHADGIVAAMSTPFDQAAAVLIDAHRVLGDVDLDDAAAVVRQGGTAAQTLLEASAAQTRIARVRAVLGLLMTARAYPSPEPHRMVIALADPPAEQWLEDQLSRTNLTPWEIVRRGLPLSLATSDDLRRRVAAILAASEQATAKAEADRRNGPNMYRFAAART